MTTATRLTWGELVRLEPRLAELRERIAVVRDTGAASGFCANEHWYRRGGFKAEMAMLVGFRALWDDPVLRSPAAYDLAYRTLYNVLPDCRHGGICRA